MRRPIDGDVQGLPLVTRRTGGKRLSRSDSRSPSVNQEKRVLRGAEVPYFKDTAIGGIDLAGVDVTLEFDRVHADDCLDCDRRKDGWIDRIRTRVTIRGAFDDAQRKRLAQVAARCPVHKTLANGVEIFDSVTFEEAKV